MTAREYAKECGIELIGKLTKKVFENNKFNYFKGEMEVEKIVYWIDEAGNEISGSKKNGWCLITADGEVY